MGLPSRTLDSVLCFKDVALDLGSDQVGAVRSFWAAHLPRTHERLSDLASAVNRNGLASVRDEGLEQVRSVVVARFPSASERLNGFSTVVNRGITTTVREATMDNVRTLGLGLLDRTEAMLEILLPGVNSSGRQMSDDSDGDTEERSRWGFRQVPRPFSFEEVRTFVVRVSQSATLRFTVVCARDTCVAVAKRLSFSDIRHILRRIHWAEAQRALEEAARVRSGDAIATASLRVAQAAYISCQRLLGERFAARAFGRLWRTHCETNSHDDVEGVSSPRQASGSDRLGGGAGEAFDSNTGESSRQDEAHSSQSSSDHIFPGRRGVPQDTNSQFNLVIKNSFLEVCDDEAEGVAWLRRRRCRSLDIDRPSFRIGIYEPYQITLDCFKTDTSTGSSSRENNARSANDGEAASSEGASAATCGADAIGAEAASAAAASTEIPPLASTTGKRSRRVKRSASSSSTCPAGYEDGGGATRATVLVKNIPKDALWPDLVQRLDELGFAAKYDFMYLPRDFTHGVGLGYALVGLTTVQAGDDLIELLDGHTAWADPDAGGELRVSWSDPQRTLSEHVERYRNSPVMHESVPDEYKPALFVEGEHVAFPAPTKAIRPPRIRLNKLANKGQNSVQAA
mmetsp:Transcript_49732/g.118553  ORF Transcript_49732/g.118553 Transcript_49732/m.118553 type:complete len:626 (-) Transcript_49732:87-1964(-)